MNIHLGYEVGTGKAVEIPLRHLAVTGQTQESGKTTTLEALISRSGLRAVAFLTKRGEASFHRARRISPYFRERTDWRFVQSILEATMRQGMKFQTSWIIKLCESRASRNEKWPAPKSLADVRRNVTLALETARGLNESVYTELGAYLDIVVPQIDSLPRTPRLELEPGINVMDLTAYSMELQALVMRSVLEFVYEHERDVITIIPEAWEFIPQARGSPVLLAAEQLIRKGGASKNYVWLDSQDIAGVHKSVLRQVGVWILGVQREIHEAKRTIEHIPVGSPKPTVQDIMTLAKGQFYCGHQDRMMKVYVMPYWLPEIEARAIARGESRVEAITQFKPTGRAWQESGARSQEPARPKPELEDDAVWKEKFHEEKHNHEQLQAEMAQLRSDLRVAEGELKRLRAAKPAPAVRQSPAFVGTPAPSHSEPGDINGFYEQFKSRLITDIDAIKSLAVLQAKPEIEVKIDRPTLRIEGTSLQGRIATLIAEGWMDQPRNTKEVFNEGRRRFNLANPAAPRLAEQLSALHTMGFLARNDDGNYQAVEGMKVRIVE